jgi:nucleotide-binding universal stress UspA family protein
MIANGKSEMRAVVVVGVDGSAGARETPRWAAAEARLRQTRLRVIHAWMFAYPGAGGGGYGYSYIGGSVDTVSGVGLNDMHHAAEELLEAVLADVAIETGGLEIERRVVEGAAAEVLVHAVAARDLLVVGSRGHGGFAGLLLGSVSQQCAHHAPCPVVIVHPAKPSASRSKSAAAARAESEATA